eukprot:scaffold108162_cov27-Phaeocystis_antarctica.AAC.1
MFHGQHSLEEIAWHEGLSNPNPDPNPGSNHNPNPDSNPDPNPDPNQARGHREAVTVGAARVL